MSSFKDKAGKYIFEISVIFVGITLSFIFEEWRTSRNEREIAKGHLIEIREEVNTVKQIVSIYDSTITAESSGMDSLFYSTKLPNKESFELIRSSLQNMDFSISKESDIIG